MKKTKYNRRRAIDCKLLEKSQSHEGYLKYQVTIREKDGTIHQQPAYGKDMQDALSRLINKERTIKVERKVMENPFLFFLSWLVVMGWPAVLLESHNTPWFLGYTFIGIIGLVLGVVWWSSYINKGQ